MPGFLRFAGLDQIEQTVDGVLAISHHPVTHASRGDVQHPRPV